jgi:hypothetical protein
VAPRRQTVIFARINRRQPDQGTLEMRSFREDMTELAASHQTRSRERRGDGTERTWIAADMVVQPDGDFMAGTLGYTTREERRIFEDELWSWIKAQTEENEGARLDAVVPFAIDLHEAQRWVAFAPAPRLQAKMFVGGFRRVLNHAVAEAGLVPAEWEVDLVASRESIDRWLRLHPAVHRLKRTIKFSNPGRDLDDDRQEMRALNARRKTEELKAANRGVLNIESEVFKRKLEGTETGDLELYLEARGAPGTGDAVFRSVDSPDQRAVDSFGRDLVRGIGTVLDALRGYVLEKDPDRWLW